MNFVKITSVLIVVTVFGLWFSVYFDDQVETMVSYALILTFGILHGANDVQLIKVYSDRRRGKNPGKLVIIGYVTVIVAILSLFYVFPTLAFVAFILVSGYHFGEQHWSRKMNIVSLWNTLLYTFYGLFILFMIFYIRYEQVNEIIYEVTDIFFSHQQYWYGLMIFGTLLAIVMIFGFSFGYISSHLWQELFLLGIFYVIFKTASLLWGFCIYFVVWHSIPSLLDQFEYLYGEVSWRAFFNYFKNSWPYWLISIFGVAGLYVVLGNNEGFFITGLIYFLAAITFPHVIVMSQLEK